jgi:hypothetical protein
LRYVGVKINLRRMKMSEKTFSPFEVLWEKKRKQELVDFINVKQIDPLLAKKGGDWLGRVRSWIQWNCANGETVIWGSHDYLKINKPLTVWDFEHLASEIASAAIEEYRKELISKGALKYLEDKTE